jgi:hypothetical protein
MILAFSDDKVKNLENNVLEDNILKDNILQDKKEIHSYINKPDYSNVEELVPLDLFGKPYQVIPNKCIIWTFIIEKPWTQIVYYYGQQFPFKFFIKIKIPSLNDYQSWKHIIPNLDFDSKTGEIIISSKDEAGALAITNLIIANFQGQLSIENILEKNLIPISITKAQQYEMVRNKLREQIIESLQGKTSDSRTDYEQDLAKNENKSSIKQNFENIDPDAYEGIEYTYL